MAESLNGTSSVALMPYRDSDPQAPGASGKVRWTTTNLSPGVKALLGDNPVASMTLNAYIRQHENGQWGDVSTEEAEANARAIARGGPVFSRYHLLGSEIWILTDPEPRDVTNILLPDEYEPPPTA